MIFSLAHSVKLTLKKPDYSISLFETCWLKEIKKCPKNGILVQFSGQLCCYWHVCMSLRMSDRKQSQAHFTFSPCYGVA